MPDDLLRVLEEAHSGLAKPTPHVGDNAAPDPALTADNAPGGSAPEREDDPAARGEGAAHEAFSAAYIEPQVPAPSALAPAVEVTTRTAGEWRIAVDPRSGGSGEVISPGAMAESLPFQELRAVPLTSAPPAAPAKRRWRRDRAAADREPAAPQSADGLLYGGPPPSLATGTAAPAARPKLTGRERRWVRRRRRVVFEEVLAWILVPVILIACYWLLKSILAAMGTTPTALVEGIKAAIQGFERR